jgi:transposase
LNLLGHHTQNLEKQGFGVELKWCAQTQWQDRRLVVAHDPEGASRRAQARDKVIAELLQMGQQCSVKLDEQDESKRQGQKGSKGRPMSDSGTKARFYHALKDAHMAHVIKVDLKAELFSYTIDEDKKRYLELLDGKLVLVTNTGAPPAEVVARYKSLADIERGFRVLKSDIEIGPVYHRLPKRIRSHALVCFMVSLTAVMEPPMFGVMEPQTVAKTTPRRGLNNGGFCLFFGGGLA